MESKYNDRWMLDDPVMWLGVDIGVRRDTSAVAAVIANSELNAFGLWGCRIFSPPVNIPKTVVALLLYMIENHRVVKIAYDPYQFYSEASRLADAGHGALLKEINQQSQMTEVANTLDTHLKQGTFYLFDDDKLRAHFSWATARETERGFRVEKRKQSRPIDGLIASAMALSEAVADSIDSPFPEYRVAIHGRSLEDLP